MNCSLPGSSVQGILQARILECVAISSSRKYLLHLSQINTLLWVECSCFTVVQGREEHSQPRRYFFPILEGVQKVDRIFNKYLLKKEKNLEQWAIQCCLCMYSLVFLTL